MERRILHCPVGVVVAESPVLIVTDDKSCRIYHRHLRGKRQGKNQDYSGHHRAASQTHLSQLSKAEMNTLN